MSPPRGGGDMPHCSGASPCPSISKPFPKPLCRATCSKRPLHPSRSACRTSCPSSATSCSTRSTAPILLSKIGRATSELQSLMRISYAVFCLKKKKTTSQHHHRTPHTYLLHH